MLLSACCSSSVKAAVGTSWHTGSTATVDRLLVGLMGSELEAMPKPEPAGTGTRHGEVAPAVPVTATTAPERPPRCHQDLLAKGPRSCWRFPKIFWLRRWMRRVTTCGDKDREGHHTWHGFTGTPDWRST
ncbi:hypothetical protein WISP_00421 [Willisornis vidua]|uniref:Secreted protein n=1 Tax=Willisornis vidua TaxID=1566151 RepID=A0ABQ9DWQ0_9PASS|nr:hypothetical protein WISP_00421 [Willisornis vidua]